MRPYTADEQSYLIATHHTHSAAEQARALDRTILSITSKRRKLLRASLVTPARRNWSETELADVAEHIIDGLPVAAVAKKLGTRSERAVRAVYARRGEKIRAVRGGVVAVRTPLAVSRLFGVHNQVIYDWIKERLLHARRANPGKAKRGAQRLVSDEALLRFINDRRSWIRFDPEKITCPDWRRAAISVRTGGRWVDVNGLAVLLCCSAPYARVLVRADRLGLPRIRHSRQWYVWIADGVMPRISHARAAQTAQDERKQGAKEQL